LEPRFADETQAPPFWLDLHRSRWYATREAARPPHNREQG
jgi:hypothetical protein